MTRKADAAALKALATYVTDYCANRGLVARFPRVCVAMMADLHGWPVRNADGGANIAHFSTYEAAHKAIVTCEHAARAKGIQIY